MGGAIVGEGGSYQGRSEDRASETARPQTSSVVDPVVPFLPTPYAPGSPGRDVPCRRRRQFSAPIPRPEPTSTRVAGSGTACGSANKKSSMATTSTPPPSLGTQGRVAGRDPHAANAFTGIEDHAEEREASIGTRARFHEATQEEIAGGVEELDQRGVRQVHVGEDCTEATDRRGDPPVRARQKEQTVGEDAAARSEQALRTERTCRRWWHRLD